MKLFFDEDMGKGIPTALRAVGLDQQPNRIDWVRAIWGPETLVPDEMWIPWAAERGYLVFSCNKAILEAQAQRELVQSTRLGIVFLTTGQGKAVEVLQLILRKWAWLETIDRHETRPFAYLMPLTGSPRRDPRVQAS